MAKQTLAKAVEELTREFRKLRRILLGDTVETVDMDEAARRLNRSKRTIRRMVQTGLLGAATIKGVPMIPVSELKRVATPVVRESVSVVEKVARARSLFKTPKSKRTRPSRRTESAPRNTRHPQD